MNRRNFIHLASKATGGLLLSSFVPARLLVNTFRRITILHTADLHSRLDAFPDDGSQTAFLGGASSRASVIASIRKRATESLLFDSGDIFNGSPYFKLFKGEAEVKAMNSMGYDAVTIGEHDFAAGMANYASQMAAANFKIVISNYALANTPLENLTVPYTCFQKGEIKIGVLATGIELQGLIDPDLYGNLIYKDALISANETADILKRVEKCDMVICLSHLGDWYPDPHKLSDAVLAKETYNIDLILSGHTHKQFDMPRKYKNKRGADVVVNMAGWGGTNISRLDFEFSGKKNKHLLNCSTVVIGKKTAD